MYGYPDSVRIVNSRAELMRAEFDAMHNLIVWPRELKGDFNSLARKACEFGQSGDTNLTEECFRDFRSNLSDEEKTASDVIVNDISFAEDGGTRVCRLIDHTRYRNDLPLPFGRMARSFHHDKGYANTHDEFLMCAYTKPGTHGLPVGMADKRCIDNLKVVVRLRAWLIENNMPTDVESLLKKILERYDNYYFPNPHSGAQPFSLHPGHLARGATDKHVDIAEPFKHRAPIVRKDDPSRLFSALRV